MKWTLTNLIAIRKIYQAGVDRKDALIARNHGWLRNMYYGVTQQVMRQNLAPLDVVCGRTARWATPAHLISLLREIHTSVGQRHRVSPHRPEHRPAGPGHPPAA